MKFSLPFPNNQLSPLLRENGWREGGILEIREMLLEETRRQNKEEHLRSKSKRQVE